jgi:hypothetical protein
MPHMIKIDIINFGLHPPTKYRAIRTGVNIRIDQKSGWRARRINKNPTIAKYGTVPSVKEASRERFFFMKEARNIIIPIFANSTG